MYSLGNLAKSRSSKKKKRIGRGNASGHGTYSTRGMKGQRSRSGGRSGLMKRAIKEQLLLKTPKIRGFKSISKKMEAVNLGDLDKLFHDGDKVTSKELFSKGLVKSQNARLKILGNGELKKSLEVYANAFSKKAIEAIEGKSGKIYKI